MKVLTQKADKTKNHKHKSSIKRLNFSVFLLAEEIIKDHPKALVFLVRYMALEVAVRQIWIKTGNVESDFEVSVSKVKSCLKAYGVTLDSKLITRVFSANNIRGSKSCKKLRDEMVHSLLKPGIYEIESRYDVLDQDIRDVMNALTSRL